MYEMREKSTSKSVRSAARGVGVDNCKHSVPSRVERGVGGHVMGNEIRERERSSDQTL